MNIEPNIATEPPPPPPASRKRPLTDGINQDETARSTDPNGDDNNDDNPDDPDDDDDGAAAFPAYRRMAFYGEHRRYVFVCVVLRVETNE